MFFPRPACGERVGVRGPSTVFPLGLHDVLRVKGFVDLPGRDRRQVVQAVDDRSQWHFDRPWGADEKHQTRLVVIGRKGLDRVAITAALSG
jgi:cobalamin biosynthesis protein CobW